MESINFFKLLRMRLKLQNDEQIAVCHKDICIHASGESAKIIAIGIVTIFAFYTLSALNQS